MLLWLFSTKTIARSKSCSVRLIRWSSCYWYYDAVAKYDEADEAKRSQREFDLLVCSDVSGHRGGAEGDERRYWRFGSLWEVVRACNLPAAAAAGRRADDDGAIDGRGSLPMRANRTSYTNACGSRAGMRRCHNDKHLHDNCTAAAAAAAAAATVSCEQQTRGGARKWQGRCFLILIVASGKCICLSNFR